MKDFVLRIDKEGRWFFREEEITHRRTYLLYCRNLTRDEMGRTILRIGREECSVEVEDAPFVVKTLELIHSENGDLKSIGVILNEEIREPLDMTTLRIGADNIPYCRVRGGMFEARFSSGAYQLLAHFIRHDDEGKQFYIVVDGKEYPLLTP